MGTRTVVLSLVAFVGLCDGEALVYGDQDRQVVVVVDDRARVPALALDRAQKQASRIYRQAGVTLVWRSAAHPTDAADVGLESESGFAVRAIVHARFRGETGAPSTLMMGAAPETTLRCGGMVHLFFDQVSTYSSIMRLDTALVLGTVVAHEIGHLLLRGNGHAGEGLMRATWKPDDWDRAASGFLVFSPRERETVHWRLAGCRDRD
jgi:hypothetical protein